MQSESASDDQSLNQRDVDEVSLFVARRLYDRRMAELVDLVPEGDYREMFRNIVEVSGGGVITVTELSVLDKVISPDGKSATFIFGGRFCQVALIDTASPPRGTVTTEFGPADSAAKVTVDESPQFAEGEVLNCVVVDSAQSPMVKMTTLKLSQDEDGMWWLATGTSED